jgi:hypothetical protein
MNLPVILNEVKDHSPARYVYAYISYLNLILHFVQDDRSKSPLLVYLYSLISIYPILNAHALSRGEATYIMAFI